MSHILNLIEEKSLPLDGIPRISTVKALSELEPRPVITQCFDYYLKPTGVDTDDGKMHDLMLSCVYVLSLIVSDIDII